MTSRAHSTASRRIVSCILAGLLALVSLLTSGCAVLTVDVDVYKGPLANHFDIHFQQAATTALAAKPLLGKLRYELEKLARYQFLQPIENDVALRRLNNQSDYLPQYEERDEDVADGFNGELYKRNYPSQDQDDRKAWLCGEFAFKSPQAAFVNRILAEYDDKEESETLQQEKEQSGLTRSQTAREVPSARFKQKLYAARGRAGTGLETLINDYYAANKLDTDKRYQRDPNRIPQKRYLPEEGVLFDALIHFSEKILFNANNDVLFGEQAGGAPALATAWVFLALEGGSNPKSVTSSYVRVLQAVGNTIQVDLNELREDIQQYQDNVDNAPREMQAMNLAIGEDPYRIVNDLFRALNDELAASLRSLPAKSKLTDPTAQAQADLDALQGPIDKAQSNLKSAEENQSMMMQALAPKTSESDSLKNSLEQANNSINKAKNDLNAAIAAAPQVDITFLKRRVQLLNARTALDYSAPRALVFDPQSGTVSVDVVFERLLRQLESDKNAASGSGLGSEQGAQQKGGTKTDNSQAPEQNQPAQNQQVQNQQAARDAVAGGQGAAAAAAAAAGLPAAGATPASPPATPTVSVSAQVASGQVSASAHVEGTPAGAPAAQTPAKPAPAPNPAPPANPPPPAIPTPPTNPTPQANPAPKPAKPATPSADDFDAAIAFVKARPPLPPRLKVPQQASAKDVIDSLISELNYQYILAVQQQGKDSPAALNYQAALDAAYGRRADLVYLRPASAYLRSSFPISSLQRDARLGGTNLLEEQGLRQIPGLTELFTDYQQVRTLQELDKQNWQNINTVRVAGAGNTNYVVAKDDIGNWYVKNYSADPKDIIQSAQSLALFGLGPSLAGGGDLINALAKQRAAANLSRNGQAGSAANALNPTAGNATPSKALAQPANSAAALVNGEMQDAQSKYDSATADELKSLEGVQGLEDAITAAWQDDEKLTGNLTALGGALQKAAAKLQQAIAKIDPQAGSPSPAASGTQTAEASGNSAAESPGVKIVDILRAEKQFYSDLSGNIDTAFASAIQKTPGPGPAGGATNSGTPPPTGTQSPTATATVSSTTPPTATATAPPAGTAMVSANVTAPAAPTNSAPAANSPPASGGTTPPAASGVSASASVMAPAPAATPAPPAAPATPTPSPADEAKQKMGQVIRDRILTTIKKRQQSVSEYENALDLITRAVAG
jgi:predicted  nucleic acid-binding Zn-ribbon protein